MYRRVAFRFIVLGLLAILLAMSAGQPAVAHCDSMDGPVVKTAQRALDGGDVNIVLIWVQEANEAEVRMVYQKTMAVRKLGPQAKELADNYFFETVVRLHRAGEGAPYTGLKPAGHDLGPAISSADQAIDDGSPKRVQHLLIGAVDAGIAKRLREVIARKHLQPNDIESGRKYVKAYVDFVHYVEAVYQAATSGPHAHDDEATASASHEARENHGPR